MQHLIETNTIKVNIIGELATAVLIILKKAIKIVNIIEN
jgi:hypothetical protein